MSSNAATDQDALYYLYLSGDWAGPFQVPQIRDLVEKGTVTGDAIAYDSIKQQHFMVEELINVANKPALSSRSSPAKQATSSTADNFDDIVEIAPEQAAAFDHVFKSLQVFYQSYLALTERNGLNLHQAAMDLRNSHQQLNDELALRCSDIGALSRLINEIDEVSDYLANRQQLIHLWQQLSELEKIDIGNASDQAYIAAIAVLKSLAEHAQQMEPAGDSSSSVLLDLEGLDDDADSVITRKILISARSEVANTKRDMDALQVAYNEAQEQHAKDLEKARKYLEKAEAARAEERHLARQTAAEVRNLAAEIQRLANEPDVIGSDDQELIDQVAHLGNELSSADISSLAYVAEDVLIRLIGHLRLLAEGGGGDTTPLRTELARARDSVIESQQRVEQLTSECDTLRQQYEQQRLAAEKASERAQDREHRLRSTVTALEVTKELHMEVMEDLKSQLHTAQTRVESMEKDLATVRGAMQDSTGTVEARGKAIQHEMERMVEMKAMLEVRSHELSASLKNAEDELAKAQTSSDDTSLAEVLAAKVNALRTTFDATTYRLQEQEKIAERLAKELEASRIEASELRSRSDSLSGELSDARSSLSSSKRRLDELHEAYANLEAERQSLQTELHHRRSTDTIHKIPEDARSSERISKLEKDALMLSRQLANEKRQVEALNEAKKSAEARVQELAREREELRTKFETLQTEHSSDHARHTSAIALSTQAAIEAERRLRELQDQVSIIESKNKTRQSTDGDRLEPSTVRVGQNNALESTTNISLVSELEQTKREYARIRAELDTLKKTEDSESVAPPELARLRYIEGELIVAQQSITDLEERHAQAVAERERVKRELERLKGEREAAAVEHRTALKSARDRLTESQARVAELEAQLSAESNSDDDSGIRTHLDQSLIEQERLGTEVQKLAGDLAKLNGTAPNDRDQQLVGLAKASQQLASEQEKVMVLTRSLMETLQQADHARNRTVELEQLVTARTSERDRLLSDLDRLRAELSTAKLGIDPAPELREAISKRDQALEELELVRQELDEVRGKLSDRTRAHSTLEQLSNEQQRIRTLEKQIATLTSENAQHQQMFNEARARMAQALIERDELATELAAIRSRPDHSAELKMLRRRLVRAKRIIKNLRRERDEAIAQQQHSATDLHELSTQISRMKTAQRAAAEALGIPVPPDHGYTTGHLAAAMSPFVDATGHGSHVPKAVTHRIAAASGFTASKDKSAGIGFGSGSLSATPAIHPGSLAPRAVTRNIFDKPTANKDAFTSAYGKPAIPGVQNEEQMHPASHGTQVLEPKRHTNTFRPTSLVRGRPWRTAVIVSGAITACAFFLAPPLIPFSSQGVVNAQVMALTAPIDGRYFDASPALNQLITANQLMGTIRNDKVDTTQLDTLTTKLSALASKQTELKSIITELAQERDSLDARITTYRTSRIESLNRRITEESKQLAIRLETLSTATADTLPGLRAAFDAQSNLVNDLSKQLLVIQDGSFPDPEKPTIVLKHETVLLKITDLNEQETTLAKDIASIQMDITREQTRIAVLKEAPVPSTNNGILYSRKANDQQWLKKGDTIAHIADPKTILIESVMHPRYMNDIQPGDQVQIELTGERRRVNGTVKDLVPLKGQDAQMATTLSSLLADHFKVRVEINPTAGPVTIGQNVKLMITGKDPGWFSRFIAWGYGETRF